MTYIPPSEIEAHVGQGSWRVLEGYARVAVESAGAAANSVLRPALGGGTRLMLAMHHRISDDIDLFIRDPQWLGYLTPRLTDCLEERLTGYEEGQTALKLVFKEGEVDFIVSMSLLGLPNERSPECYFDLEPVAEVLAKKLFYRGWALTPRDLFDWRAMERLVPPEALHAREIAGLLTGRFELIENALETLRKAPVHQARWAGIRTSDLPDFQESIAWAKERVQEFREISAAWRRELKERGPDHPPGVQGQDFEKPP